MGFTLLSEEGHSDSGHKPEDDDAPDYVQENTHPIHPFRRYPVELGTIPSPTEQIANRQITGQDAHPTRHKPQLRRNNVAYWITAHPLIPQKRR